MRWVQPDHVAGSIHDVDYDHLVSEGVRAVLYDLENTLCPWRQWELDAPTWSLLRGLGRRGIRVGVVTNASLPHHHPLVVALEAEGVVVVDSARKPLQGGFRAALRRLGIPPAEAAMVGDQVLTDILGGRWAGLTTVLVAPRGPEESWPTKVNRTLERLLGRRIPAQERAGSR